MYWKLHPMYFFVFYFTHYHRCPVEKLKLQFWWISCSHWRITAVHIMHYNVIDKMNIYTSLLTVCAMYISPKLKGWIDSEKSKVLEETLIVIGFTQLSKKLYMQQYITAVQLYIVWHIIIIKKSQRGWYIYWNIFWFCMSLVKLETWLWPYLIIFHWNCFVYSC